MNKSGDYKNDAVSDQKLYKIYFLGSLLRDKFQNIMLDHDDALRPLALVFY